MNLDRADATRSIAASFVTRLEYVRRSMVIVVDGLGLSFPSVEYVRRAARQFIKTQMQPGDLVAIGRRVAATVYSSN